MSTVDPFVVLKQQIYDELYPKILDRVREELGASKVEHDRSLDVHEAADYIGVSPDCVRIMVREKQIKHYRAGSIRSRNPKIMIRQSILDQWVRDQEEQSISSREDMS